MPNVLIAIIAIGLDFLAYHYRPVSPDALAALILVNIIAALFVTLLVMGIRLAMKRGSAGQKDYDRLRNKVSRAIGVIASYLILAAIIDGLASIPGMYYVRYHLLVAALLPFIGLLNYDRALTSLPAPIQKRIFLGMMVVLACGSLIGMSWSWWGPLY